MPIAKLNWGWIALRGTIAVLFGIFALARPGITLSAIIAVFGVYAIVDGVYVCVAAISGRREEPQWGAYLFGGVVGIAIGMVTLALPSVSALALLYAIAAWAIVRGTIEIVAAVRLRKLIKGEWVYILAGVLSVAFGVYLMMRPGVGSLVLMTWLGLYAVLFGIVLIVLAFRIRSMRVPPLASA